MDRRQYLSCITAVISAGCVGDNSTSQPDNTPTGTTLEPPEDRFQQATETSYWEFEVTNRTKHTVDDGGVYVATESDLSKITSEGISWSLGSMSDSYSVQNVDELRVSEDTVYYIGRLSEESEMGAVEADSGDKLWTRELDEISVKIIDVAENSIFVSDTNDDPAKTPLYAFDTTTGEEQWQTVTGMDMGSAVSHGLCLVYSVVDGLTALATDNGEVQWEHDPGTDYGADLHVISDTLCVAIEEKVLGYSLPDGTHQWTYTSDEYVKTMSSAPEGSEAADRLLISNENSNIAALDVATGEQRWAVQPDGGRIGYRGMCVNSDSLFYHSGTVLAAYNLATGTKQWEDKRNSNYRASLPIIADGNLILVFNDEGQKPILIAFETESGSRSWQKQIQIQNSLNEAPRVEGICNGHVVLRIEQQLLGVPLN